MTMQFDRLKAVARFSNDLNLGHHLEQGDEPLPHHMMVLYHHRPYSICHAFIPFRSV
jgi:hypothetical protein